jgi:hypothetical protein
MASEYVTLDTYKTLSKQPFLEWDEKFDSILLGWDDELFYNPNL